MSAVASHAERFVEVGNTPLCPDGPSLADRPLGSSTARLEIVNPTSDSTWNEGVMMHPDVGPFHRSGWADVLRHTYGHRPLYARITENEAATVQVPLAEVTSWLTGKRGVSVPFADNCDALARGDSRTAFPTLCDFGRRRGWKYLELRGPALVPKEATPSTRYHGHELDLTLGLGAVRARYAPSVRRAIRKAETSGLRIEHGTSVKSVQSYYELHARTRRRHGVPPQPWNFFANLHRSLLDKGEGFVTLAFDGSKPVAGAVYLHAGTRAVYKFGAADLAHQAMRPANLVMASAIDRLIEIGIRSLSFGRTSETNDGLRRFKAGWGAQETKICYYRYHLAKSEWVSHPDRTNRCVNTVFRHMPLGFNRALGALLYPHLD